MIYHKRIREEKRNETEAYTNELHDALMLKMVPLSENAGNRNLISPVVMLNK